MCGWRAGIGGDTEGSYREGEEGQVSEMTGDVKDGQMECNQIEQKWPS